MSVEVVVFGGTGKTGRAVTVALSAAGASVRPLGRDGYADPARAAAGADAAYLIAPNLDPDEPALVREVVSGLRSAGVRRIGYHSVAAPYVPEMPHHLGKAESERIVRTSGLDWTILQPCAYIQNLVPLIDVTLSEPEMVVPYSVDTPFGLVDLDDVGHAAARVLTAPGHAGATYELGGPALVSVADAAGAAGDVLGRSVRAQRVDAGPDVHPWLAAMFAYYDRHGLPAGALALRGLLGREPTDLRGVFERELRG